VSWREYYRKFHIKFPESVVPSKATIYSSEFRATASALDKKNILNRTEETFHNIHASRCSINVKVMTLQKAVVHGVLFQTVQQKFNAAGLSESVFNVRHIPELTLCSDEAWGTLM
jgi:hypothetical protein